ncbi:MAG: hypothetical protein P4L84_30725 [Isosphaeraceae bacterium]|nr:hypothetical protein [Isosphaeraceae bacterium]
MTDHDLLEQELNAMGHDLRQFPSVAANVMAAISEPPAAASERELFTVTTSGLRQASRRIISGRGAIRKWGLRRAFGVIAATAVALMLVVLSIFLNPGAVTFAQVQQRLNHIQSASLRMRQAVVVTYKDGETRTIRTEQRVFVRGDGRSRIELPEGKRSVISESDFKMLEIDPAAKTAKLTYLYAFGRKRDVITTLRSLHTTAAAHAIAAKLIDGKPCPGFRIEEQHATLRVWVDRATQLPVLAERTMTLPNEVPPTEDGAIRPGSTQITQTYAAMKFDEPLPDDLFDVSPPAGFAVTTVGKPPADRRELFAEPLVLTPLRGVGPLHFGMPEVDVFQLLGKPDETEILKPAFPVNKDTSQIDDKPRPPGGQVVVLTEFHVLHYDGLGLRLTVEVRDGLTGIECISQARYGPSVRDFPGATDKKIRISSSEQEIRMAYGKPDSSVSPDVLAYSDLGLRFQLTEQRTVQSISAADGNARRLRFEWRVPPE